MGSSEQFTTIAGHGEELGPVGRRRPAGHAQLRDRRGAPPGGGRACGRAGPSHWVWPCRRPRGSRRGRAGPVQPRAHHVVRERAACQTTPTGSAPTRTWSSCRCSAPRTGTALAHVSYGGTLYNGYPATAVTSAGASRLGIHLVDSLVSRGVLLDVARAKGVDVLDGGYAITPADLDAACALAGWTSSPATSCWCAPGR